MASLYLVMVGVMVGLNYRLRGRHTTSGSGSSSANSDKMETVSDENEIMEPVVRAASVCFSEDKGSYSSLVSAETWSNLDNKDHPPPSSLSRPRLVDV